MDPPAPSLPPPPEDLSPRPHERAIVPKARTPWRLITLIIVGYVVTTVAQILVFVRLLPVPWTAILDGRAAVPDTLICQETDRLLNVAEGDALGDPEPVDDLADLVPVIVGRRFAYVGAERIPDARTIGDERGPVWEAELKEDDFLHGFARVWQLEEETTASVWVYQFGSPAGALSFQRFALEERSCPYTYDIFEIDGVAGSIGMQIWWADGTESEQVSFVRGSRRYLVNVRGPEIPDRGLVLRLTGELAEIAA